MLLLVDTLLIFLGWLIAFEVLEDRQVDVDAVVYTLADVFGVAAGNWVLANGEYLDSVAVRATYTVTPGVLILQ